ncbi:hypothetical protein LV85_00379 [Algoriphagus chordae]|uniref:Uncharacterized protein n=1 Tax=Algoriphagus chordae TaxID=237019 RepID=A0A2W7RAU2_9BACT|nr:hypothetical protein LV85_00379 [Algoriphagus chordae]
MGHDRKDLVTFQRNIQDRMMNSEYRSPEFPESIVLILTS